MAKKKHFDVLMKLEPDNQMEWIDFYNKHWDTLQLQDIETTKKLVASGFSESTYKKDLDFSPLADWLIDLHDEAYLSKKAAISLIDHFNQIPVESWIKLFETYQAACFENIFASVGYKTDILKTAHLLVILNNLIDKSNSEYKQFVSQQAAQLPAHLKGLKLSDKNNKKVARDILKSVLKIEDNEIKNDSEWLKKITIFFTTDLPREYVNDILIRTILDYPGKTNLTRQIIAICKRDLTQSVADKLQPPADWSRPVPHSNIHKSQWNILSDFLKSPVQQIFNYQAVKAKRTEMEYAIKRVTIDLEMEIIRKGSPHTLRLTKTQDVYKRELTKWEKDAALLKEAEEHCN